MESNFKSTVSIISPCKNEVNFIDKFIYDVFQQKLEGIELEIIIADGKSNDGTREKIEALSKKHNNIKLIINNKEIVSTGLNLAIDLSKSEYIIRMDIHTRYANDYIFNIVKILKTNIYQCVGGPWVPIANNLKSKAIKIAFQSRVISGGALSRSTNFNGLVDTVYLGAWRRDYLIELGCFDEDLIRNQDDELSLRIIKNGGRIFQSNSIRSKYSVRNKFRNLLKQYFQYGYWKFPILLKHKKQGKFRHLLPSFLVLSNLLIYILGLFLNYFLQSIILSLFGYYLLINFLLLIENKSTNNIKYIPLSSFAVLIMHFSYGLGYIYCLLKFLFTKKFISAKMSSLSR